MPWSVLATCISKGLNTAQNFSVHVYMYVCTIIIFSNTCICSLTSASLCLFSFSCLSLACFKSSRSLSLLCRWANFRWFSTWFMEHCRARCCLFFALAALALSSNWRRFSSWAWEGKERGGEGGREERRERGRGCMGGKEGEKEREAERSREKLMVTHFWGKCRVKLIRLAPCTYMQMQNILHVKQQLQLCAYNSTLLDLILPDYNFNICYHYCHSL